MLITLLDSSASLRHRLNAVVAGWQRLFQIASNPYRPERHYMRGPGPKWRAKQQGQHGVH
jgi:hypothetical protein